MKLKREGKVPKEVIKVQVPNVRADSGVTGESWAEGEEGGFEAEGLGPG